jgi:glycosyltransferase involved in cell wall biosynthesis
LTSPNPALFAPPQFVISPAGYESGSSFQERSQAQPGLRSGLAARLREALSQGGLRRARGLLWPADLPAPETGLPVWNLPPVVPPEFIPPFQPLATALAVDGPAPLDLPETYILYHGPQAAADLRRLLDAWSWAAGSLGDYYPLLVVGLDEPGRQILVALLNEYNLAETVRALPELSLAGLASLYTGSAAVFHPAGVSPWGGSLRLALACARPVVALETPLADALVGPAAYLVPPAEDRQAVSRALGAALITVIVEESVSEGLVAAARQRAAGWANPDQEKAFTRELLRAYNEILAG